jgi:selenide,water dikinase
MHQSEQPIVRELVLVGGGHSHVVLLKHFAMHPVPGLRLTLICRDTHTPYSGMLPGYVAGHYDYDMVHIDLDRLATFANARFLRDEVTGIDRATQRVQCRTRPPIDYDVLSINIGSTPNTRITPGAAVFAVPVKPINQFNQRWLQLLQRLEQADRPLHVAVVGGGAGGVELILAIHHRLHREQASRQRDTRDLRFSLFTAGTTLLPTHNARVQGFFARTLAERGIDCHLNSRVEAVREGALELANGKSVAVDEVLWVTQASGATWLRETGLALDDQGFLRVNHLLQSITDPAIFAAGDIASIEGSPREKAGVFAVRMGKPLARNLELWLRGQPLRPYRPQKHWLALISTGDRHAVASRGEWFSHGHWTWRWKDWIDRRFMARFCDLPDMQDMPSRFAATQTPLPLPLPLPLTEEEQQQALSAMAMRCGGCGAKVGSTVLRRALSDLDPIEDDAVLVGLHAQDDAAVVRVPEGKLAVHTIDFFRAFIDDPYVFGRIAANHALGDIFAMGAIAQSAMALVTVPAGLERVQEATLRHLMKGAVEVLNTADCALVGGHTGEGKELALGFAVNGFIDADAIIRKNGLQAGQVLILTKPIGTGALFTAHARYQSRGRWIDEALASMQVSNRKAADILRAAGATACTDITGFGLLGHLVEMTQPSGVDAELNLAAIPWLDGALECVQAGFTSSLQPANVRLCRAIRNQADSDADPRQALLFDPQTAGGLLAGVPAERAAACLSTLHANGYAHAAVIGRVLPLSDEQSLITVMRA